MYHEKLIENDHLEQFINKIVCYIVFVKFLIGNARTKRLQTKRCSPYISKMNKVQSFREISLVMKRDLNKIDLSSHLRYLLEKHEGFLDYIHRA